MTLFTGSLEPADHAAGLEGSQRSPLGTEPWEGPAGAHSPPPPGVLVFIVVVSAHSQPGLAPWHMLQFSESRAKIIKGREAVEAGRLLSDTLGFSLCAHQDAGAPHPRRGPLVGGRHPRHSPLARLHRGRSLIQGYEFTPQPQACCLAWSRYSVFMGKGGFVPEVPAWLWEQSVWTWKRRIPSCAFRLAAEPGAVLAGAHIVHYLPFPTWQMSTVASQ